MRHNAAVKTRHGVAHARVSSRRANATSARSKKAQIGQPSGGTRAAQSSQQAAAQTWQRKPKRAAAASRARPRRARSICRCRRPGPTRRRDLRKQHASLTRPPGYVPLVQGCIECEPRRRGDVDGARRRYERDGDRDQFADAIYEATVETSTVNGAAGSTTGWTGAPRKRLLHQRWVGPLSCLDGRGAVDDSVNGRGGVRPSGGSTTTRRRGRGRVPRASSRL